HQQGEDFYAMYHLQFEVIDTGVGITPEYIEKIFLLFEQVRDATHQPPGIGLGLTISQRFAQIIKGELQVKSELGHGSTFSLKLPVVVVTEKLSTHKQMTSSKIKEVNTTDFYPPSEEELKDLFMLAKRGNIGKIKKRITHLEEMDKQYIPFTHKLGQLAQKFDAKGIQMFLKQFLK
ncbi:ATP-binding protein, partial [Anaerolineales bacterium HSG24]|nr:ATP-binding protein [Anaerolineales bacterium HSG24]